MRELIPFLKTRGIKEAYLFGSRARGEEREGSDWDLGVRFTDEIEGLEGLSRMARLEVELQDFLEAPVDLIDLAETHLTLLYEIVWKGRCLFTDDDSRRVDRELDVRRKFEDYQDIQAFYTRALRERLGRVS